jgi:hypothetical protein
VCVYVEQRWCRGFLVRLHVIHGVRAQYRAISLLAVSNNNNTTQKHELAAIPSFRSRRLCPPTWSAITTTKTVTKEGKVSGHENKYRNSTSTWDASVSAEHISDERPSSACATDVHPTTTTQSRQGDSPNLGVVTEEEDAIARKRATDEEVKRQALQKELDWLNHLQKQRAQFLMSQAV